MSTKTSYEEKVPQASANGTDAAISAYYWQLEQLLDRIENSTTHYQLFGIGRSATNEQISQAYRHILALLHPSYRPPGFCAPQEMQARMKQAVEKISLAGSILLNFGKRIEYDNSLSRRSNTPLPLNLADVPRMESAAVESPPAPSADKPEEKQEAKSSAPARDPKTVLLDDNSTLKPIATQRPIGTTLTTKTSSRDRRRGSRLKLSIPVYVSGYDRQGCKWREIAKTVNVNRFGVAIEMRTRVPQGTVLHLSLPLPVKLRTHGYADHSYNVYAIVRRVQPPKDGVRIVGVELLGERPPAGYLQQPWTTFRTTKWLGADRRWEPRKVCVEAVEIEFLNQAMQPIQSATATTEDISCSGMRILITGVPDDFDYIRVSSRVRNCSGMAAVCNRYVGGDGRERLCLNFLDTKWPL